MTNNTKIGIELEVLSMVTVLQQLTDTMQGIDDYYEGATFFCEDRDSIIGDAACAMNMVRARAALLKVRIDKHKATVCNNHTIDGNNHTVL